MNYNSNHVNECASILNKCCIIIAVCIGCFVFPAECSHKPNTSSINQPFESRSTSIGNPVDSKQGKDSYLFERKEWPVEEEPASDYMLTINGQPVFTHQARVSAHPFDQWWSGYQRPLEQTEIASFAAWDMNAPVEVSIVSARPVKDVRIRPRSYGVDPKVEDNTIRFMVNKPGQLTVEVNGTHRALHLFANPPQDIKPEVAAWDRAWNLYAKAPFRELVTTRLHDAVPDLCDSKVHYFGPGVHCPGLIRVESNQTIYLAEGAVVYGAIIAEKAENISIIGRGILDGSKFERLIDWLMLITLYDCKNVRIEGIILRDPCVFTIGAVASSNVNIRNVKIVGSWRYNSDGIDLMNCQNVNIEDSFIRSFDDGIVLKGYGKWGGRAGWKYTGDDLYAAPVRDIQVRRCVIWNDWGGALEIGVETVASEISDILFEDCDIIHTTHAAMRIQNGDRALCRNIVFKNIRVELDDDLTRPVVQTAKYQKYKVDPDDRYIPQLIAMGVVTGQGLDNVRGHIEDIQFKDIEVTAHGMPPSTLQGFDDEHLVRRVSIENLRVNGKLVTNLEAGGFTANEFVHDISIKTENTSRLYSDSKSWDQSVLIFSQISGGTELDAKWEFMWDPNDEGISKEWFSEKYDDSKWFNIGTDSCWEEQPVGKQWEQQHGKQYDGFGWYRNRFTVPSSDSHKKIRLGFGAVDEACKVWINGQLVLDRPFPYKGDTGSWTKVFEVDITDYVRYDQPNVLAVRVEDNSGGGGIWRPVKLLFQTRI